MDDIQYAQIGQGRKTVVTADIPIIAVETPTEHGLITAVKLITRLTGKMFGAFTVSW
ncbi:MAG: hypothetical protein LBQ50_12980 [Planctomycetaceae bacterium]|jgi:hypothetical protein|nr:hypothetical protein [Planctomycetaceae bacterium]